MNVNIVLYSGGTYHDLVDAVEVVVAVIVWLLYVSYEHIISFTIIASVTGNCCHIVKTYT